MGLLSQSALNLYYISDAGWAGFSETRRATSYKCMFLGSNCISWNMKKQPTVTRSSAEVEYRSMTVAASELTWIVWFLRSVNVFLRNPPTLFSDNLSAFYLTTNPILHARAKS